MTLVLGLCGSLRRASYNRLLLEVAAGMLPGGARLEVHEGIEAVPSYNEDLASTPRSVAELREAIAAADAVLVATPEYNSSMPGHLKNALDWASRPFPANALRAKPVAVIGASTGLFGAVWAQAEVRKVLTTIGAVVVDADLPVGLAHEAFTASGALADDDNRRALAAVLDRLLTHAGHPMQQYV